MQSLSDSGKSDDGVSASQNRVKWLPEFDFIRGVLEPMVFSEGVRSKRLRSVCRATPRTDLRFAVAVVEVAVYDTPSRRHSGRARSARSC